MLKREENIKNAVKEYYHKNISTVGIPDEEHIINIGTSIMMEKWGIERNPGSFVRAICNNKLMEAFAHADHINRINIYFYILLYNNLEYIY